MGFSEFYVSGPPGACLLVFPGVSSAPAPLNSVPVVARRSLTRSFGIWASQKPPEVAARPSRALVQAPAHRGVTLFSTLKKVA